MKKLAKVLLVGAIAATTAFSASYAAAINVKTGSVGGNYDSVIGPSLKKAGKKQGLVIRTTNSAGSEENINFVNGKARNAGLAQRNVLVDFQDNHEGYDSVGGLASVGIECGLLVVPAVNNRPLKVTDLNGEKVAMGKKGSGTAVTFNQIAPLNAELAAMSPKAKSGKRTLGKIESGRYGAMFFVSAPDPKNPIIKEVVNNPNLAFADLSELNLGELGEGKKPALFISEIPVKTNFIGNKVTQRAVGVCTAIDIVVDEDAMPAEIQDALYEASKNVKSVKGSLFSFYNDVKNKAEKAIK